MMGQQEVHVVNTYHAINWGTDNQAIRNIRKRLGHNVNFIFSFNYLPIFMTSFAFAHF